MAKKKRKRKKKRKVIPMTWARKVSNWNSGIKKRGSDLRLDYKTLDIPEKCTYCEVKLVPRNTSLDHDLPIQRKGKDSMSNYRFICFPCNRSKGTLTGEEYLNLVIVLNSLGKYTRNLILRKLRSAWRIR